MDGEIIRRAPGPDGTPSIPDGMASGAGGLALPEGAADPAVLRAALVEAVGTLPALPAPDPADRYAVRNLTVLWLEADKTEHTRRAYFADLAAWLGWCARTGLDPLRARRADLDAWKGTLTVTGRDGAVRRASAATQARRLAAISSWYRYLQSNDVTERNPAGAVRRPRTSGSSPLPALSAAEAATLIDHTEARALRLGSEPAWRDAALVAVLFYTGLRVSAVTGAQVSDLGYDSGHTILWHWKKGRTRDFVPLAPPALAPLRRYLDVRAARAGVPAAELGGPLLVTAPHAYDPGKSGGRPLTQRDVWSALRRLAGEAGLASASTITPHTARRTTGTVLLAEGVPVQKVQDLLGHSDIRTTRERYDAHRHKLDTSSAYTLAQLLAAHRRPGGDRGDA